MLKRVNRKLKLSIVKSGKQLVQKKTTKRHLFWTHLINIVVQNRQKWIQFGHKRKVSITISQGWARINC